MGLPSLIVVGEALDENDEDEKVLRELFLHSKQRGEKSWSG